MLRTAWVLARKDLKLYLRDRTALLLSLLMPICLATVFGAAMGAMGGGDEGISRVKMLVEDLDQSDESRALVSALESSNGLRIKVESNARKQISDGKAPAALLIPSGYGEDLRAGRKPALKLFRDPGQVIEQQVIAGCLFPALVEGGGKPLARGMMQRGMRSFGLPEMFVPQAVAMFDQAWDQIHEHGFDTADSAKSEDGTGSVRGNHASDGTINGRSDRAIDGTSSRRADHSSDGTGSGRGDHTNAVASDGKASGSSASPARLSSGRVALTEPEPDKKHGFNFGEDVPRFLGVETEDVAGGQDKSQKTAGQAHAVSGIAVMMLLFGLVACGGTLLEEQSSGTLQRLQLTPSSGSAILFGKFLFTAIAGAMQVALLFLYGSLIFSVPVFRDPLAVLVVSIAVVCAATGLGLFLAVTCRTRKQLDGLSTLIILIMSALGGSWFPLIVTPEWYRRLGHFTLNAWAMDAYQGIFWYGKGLSGLWLEISVLFAIGAAMSLLALRGWRRRFEIGT